MARKTKEEINIDAFCKSLGLNPKEVQKFSKILLEGVRYSYTSLSNLRDTVSYEEVLKIEATNSRKIIKFMSNLDTKSEDEQRLFIYSNILRIWLWDKVEPLMERVSVFGGEIQGPLYKYILMNSYFSDLPCSNYYVANNKRVSEGVIEYRKREAIKLFGIMLWIYCLELDKGHIYTCIINKNSFSEIEYE